MNGRTLVLCLIGAILLALATMVAVPLLVLSRIDAPPLQPATPQLLQGVTAASGWFGEGCGRPETSVFPSGLREAVSPDLTSRLATAFPSGSDGDTLQSALLTQGFRLKDPCRDDPSVHRATFIQTGLQTGLQTSLGSHFPIHAVVAWKQTTTGQIAWVKGFVSYQGL